MEVHEVILRCVCCMDKYINYKHVKDYKLKQYIKLCLYNYRCVMNTLHIFLYLLPLVGSFFTQFHKPRIHRCNVDMLKRNYPFSQTYYENYIKRLNSKNLTLQHNEILDVDKYISRVSNKSSNRTEDTKPTYRIIINNGMFTPLFDSPNEDDDNGNKRQFHQGRRENTRIRSDNFELVRQTEVNFTSVGGYDIIKLELEQCIDILSNYSKYAEYNVRAPKGLIFEGPPGNGKTLLAKALSGQANTSFIAVSGSEFQDKYVGVGSNKVRELFNLACDNVHCIIFIDEIDALGRSRSSDGESSSSERDNTLNSLLVALDGFKRTNGVFIVGATNRADLLDAALLRPGRIDKRIYIGNPDEKTRKEIIRIHIEGKPYDETVSQEKLVEMTTGFSGAQIENILNEAMLNSLKYDRYKFNMEDVEMVMNKMMVGWQPTEHQFTNDIIDHIAIHEMGHVIVGLLCSNHANMTKVIINLSSPSSPAYTVFKSSTSAIFTREALIEHLMILLAGRIAEEVIYGVSVTTGAISDFDEAFKLAHKMITYYGMGEQAIYPHTSEKYKEKIDNEIMRLLQDAYGYAEYIVQHSKDFILDSSELLKEKRVLNAEELIFLIHNKYPNLFDLLT